MTTLEMILLVLLVVDALALAGLVLIQQGKGADVGAAFGAGAANTMFGSRGSASFLVKATSWLAVGFFVISFGLAYTAKERAGSLRTEGLPGIPTVVDEVPADDVSTDAVPVDDGFGDPLTGRDETVDSEIPDV